MIVTYIRSSSYNGYDYCQMQYFLTYVLGHRSESGKKADLGTMTHKVMEVLAGLKKFQQDNPRKKYLVVEDEAVGKVRIDKARLLTNELVEELIDLSYNSYKKGSPHHKWTPADRKEVARLSWLALHWKDGRFDPRYRNVVDPEPHFDIAIDEDWAKYEYEMPNGEKVEGRLAIKGTIDLVTEVDDGVIEVIDWKTGRRLDWATGQEKDYKKLQNDAQLLLYNYAISKLYPEYKQAIMTIFFIKDGGPFSLCFDEKDQKRFLEMLKNRFEEIKKNVAPKPLRDDRSHWKCTKLCHFYKNNWPGTDTPMCVHVGNKLKADGLEKTVKDCTKEGFSIGYYEAPG